MPLPPDIDKNIRETIDEIWKDAQNTNQGTQGYFRIKTRIQNLLHYLSDDEKRFKSLIAEMDKWVPSHYGILAGYVEAIKKDYERGLFDSIAEHIETNVNVDYKRIAEQIFEDSDENVANGHVPAGILMGAVLENSLRTLCQRKGIDILNDKGDYKTLDPLITDLQKANIFNKAKADMLKSWAKTRNYLAHGHFEEVSRQDVEDMISGVKRFLAEYL